MSDEHFNEVPFEEERGPDLSSTAVRHYIATRVSSLKPPPYSETRHLINPFPLLKPITFRQWMFILVAFLAWTWDAFDFFSVSLTATAIAKTFDRPVSDVTWGITLVLMLRSVGAVIFGLAGDRWGRKWPLIINLFLFTIIEMATGFTQTYEQFLAVRALFGICMGAAYGIAMSTALEALQTDGRGNSNASDAAGFISGLLQQGYAFGYLLCVAFNRAFVNTPHGWRALFWFGAGPPLLIALFRYTLPETDGFLAMKAMHEQGEKTATRAYIRAAKNAFKTHWLMFVYLIFLMTGMNFMSHGSQDLYPTRLTVQLSFSENASTVTNSVANFGALSGGILLGHFSQFLGRRLTIMAACVVGAALIYPWGFTKQNAGVNATAFFMQMCVQGAWGVIPIHLSELSPPRFRALVIGTAYQLGNLASSAASTIESRIGEQFPLKDANGKVIPDKYDYGRVMAILMGAVFAYTFVVTFIGPERRGGDLVGAATSDDLARRKLEGDVESVQGVDTRDKPLPQEHVENHVVSDKNPEVATTTPQPTDRVE